MRFAHFDFPHFTLWLGVRSNYCVLGSCLLPLTATTSHPPSYWLSLFSSQTFSCINTPTALSCSHTSYHLPMQMEQTECSETSAYKSHMPVNYPKKIQFISTIYRNVQFCRRHCGRPCSVNILFSYKVRDVYSLDVIEHTHFINQINMFYYKTIM